MYEISYTDSDLMFVFQVVTYLGYFILTSIFPSVNIPAHYRNGSKDARAL